MVTHSRKTPSTAEEQDKAEVRWWATLDCEGTEPPGLTLQVGAVGQDDPYVIHREPFTSGARKPMLCARCSSKPAEPRFQCLPHWPDWSLCGLWSPSFWLRHPKADNLAKPEPELSLLEARPESCVATKSWLSEAKHLIQHDEAHFCCIQAPRGPSVVIVPIDLCKPKYGLAYTCNPSLRCWSCQPLWSALTPVDFPW